MFFIGLTFRHACHERIPCWLHQTAACCFLESTCTTNTVIIAFSRLMNGTPYSSSDLLSTSFLLHRRTVTKTNCFQSNFLFPHLTFRTKSSGANSFFLLPLWANFSMSKLPPVFAYQDKKSQSCSKSTNNFWDFLILCMSRKVLFRYYCK